ncbi:DUF1707 domain-containing protein [Nonomuraea sp. NPDC003709]|uniref:DUF1707 SHOCT-like domain-containing protein n=1 Tax=Nonomuraea sp. NPDC003709 TaxID=3154450 RepID=UPI0033B3D7A6
MWTRGWCHEPASRDCRTTSAIRSLPGAAVGEGRLTPEEFEQRLSAVLAARTHGEADPYPHRVVEADLDVSFGWTTLVVPPGATVDVDEVEPGASPVRVRDAAAGGAGQGLHFVGTRQAGGRAAAHPPSTPLLAVALVTVEDGLEPDQRGGLVALDDEFRRRPGLTPPLEGHRPWLLPRLGTSSKEPAAGGASMAVSRARATHAAPALVPVRKPRVPTRA